MENYNIAVIGESMVRKSTWIASLYENDVGKRLISMCMENTKRQTKICTRYILQAQAGCVFHIREIK